ncbi:MAG: alpha/beta hydrolase, partial [Bacteroidota bacterium]
MKHIKKKILILLGLVLFMSSISVIGQNKSEKSAQEIFPDTPENRTLVQEAYEQFLDINKKHGHFIEVNGVNMFYLEWGDSSGTPLIWSHGYSSSGFELAAVAKELVEAGYHVYSITYRGHGQTQVDDYNFSLAHIADDIAAMMDQLGIKKAVIGGLSLGGGVSTTFYENYPQRALGLILEDGGGDAVQIRTEIMYPETKEMMKNWPELQT